MPSIWEVLEFLRIKGGKALLAEIQRAFNKYDGTVRRAVKDLENRGYVKVYYTTIKTKRGKEVPRVMVEMTENAIKLLRKYNVDSFYDLPMAKERERWFIEKFGRRFIRFDNINK